MRDYSRVVPRDLFNEAKLLKCLGQLSLSFYNGQHPNVEIRHTSEDRGFLITQDSSDGSISCRNVRFYHRTKGRIYLSTSLNSRQPYPMDFRCGDVEGEVFNDDGSLSDEFKTLIG